ncbi:MAG: hypothetical protein A3G60_01010 [Candidatus Ryanbacteria bacterium RIFCSPLOWO2_12_FULL_47_9c]|uniref:TrbC/VIRB2 family protein n=3 Tax=Parcubacteria group TaxID=1794811 RepID=A0A1G2H271_9BACT|nr:MAG: hypothetical protein UY02_C0050G0002 [Candidatus Giovannonibacteria bacterium GW2011_GWB1_47_6b]KKU84938.1 MAG: hypothetical protein UY14_C0039G0003 [Parcubacteria group bacterium GW2011_GWA1_47_9]OGZ56149.1 MAG: hypothetical protein A3J04_00315 [Candidatus Ryanbacteria bacterium RIFCSPLOWO2_02_FULL_47_14]OGZ56572.1 MAG: hypothetical protein A3G60_01010 [Candidatus Ryanbacteria bacterium RIFCSPLOWO2_12_FULL_47_9c]
MAIHRTALKKTIILAILGGVVLLASTSNAFAQDRSFGPFTNSKEFRDLLVKLANFISKFGLSLVAFFLVLSGFKFISAQGNVQKLESAKKMFYWTVVGAILVVGAGAIAKIVIEFGEKL